MSTVKHVGKCRSLVEIEEIISQIESSDSKTVFRFPIDTLGARHSPMHDASRLQMVVTLARQKLEDDYLDIHPNAQELDAQQAVCDYSPGIAGVRLSKGIRIGSKEIDRRDVLTFATSRMKAMDSQNFDLVVKGRCIDLLCVGGSKIQYLKPLFSSRGKAKEKDDMAPVMRKLVDRTTQQSRAGVPESLVHALALFSAELIQNTQEHAVTDHAGRPYLSHVEGMLMGWTRFYESTFREDFSGHPELKKYWNEEAAKTETGAKSLRAFEVSYFDSGPGLVSRYTGKPVQEMTLEDERGALLRCLQHKSTSKSQAAAGEGLPSVLQELRQIGGLMRVRTGRLSMFNAFTPGDNRDLFAFNDWTETSLSPVQGAVISILVPLRAQ
ncbi:TPA: hypothetical protein VDV84_002282 [Pseudomonas aeruginosa]|uniref:hypothetical protein n=1 Tax=Pseudomonadales TaxID=72274 RepID=UPI0021E206BA|nr:MULTISPECIES: hypothetical protein [Pseudomonadaceae]MCV0176038.1 hypothetical protein [Pseudomonas aeruginosa]MDP5688185.1 hypothetical protein [Pseudomonas aeruginosa]HBO2549553.1 hypothetical protein [Pseudomonas aeruginosa]HBO2581225.1 hypothetical protein [Pseudomonas aeruginosa]HBO2600034.1 hypothetical protein [Pseudomonas aeruginosa]